MTDETSRHPDVPAFDDDDLFAPSADEPTEVAEPAPENDEEIVPPTAEPEEQFAVEELLDGEHQVTVKMKGYEEASKRFEVAPSKTTELRVKLKRIFSPDIEITTVNGTVKRGMLLEQTALGSYRIETRPGLVEVIDSDDVKSVKPID